MSEDFVGFAWFLIGIGFVASVVELLRVAFFPDGKYNHKRFRSDDDKR